jgi:hypothetical protein
MARIEQVELEQQRHDIQADLRNLVEKYRAIFDWDVPEINQELADKLLLTEMHKSLDEIEKMLAR